MQTLHGVGGQVAASTAAFGSEQRPNHEGMKSINAARLSKFLESASQALTTLLEEDAERKYGASGEAQDQKDVAFSEKVNGARCGTFEFLTLFMETSCNYVQKQIKSKTYFARSYFCTTACWNASVTEISGHLLLFQPITKELCVFSWSASNSIFRSLLSLNFFLISEVLYKE